MATAKRKLYKIVVLFTGICFCVTGMLNAQYSITVGEKVPDLLLTNLINYPKDSLRFSDFEGKPLILVFWGVSCVPCVKSLPRMDSLNNANLESLQILLMGVSEEVKTRELYKAIKKRHPGFNLPTAIVSKEISSTFGVYAVPHYIWIDSYGMVAAVTNELQQEDFSAFVRNEEVTPRISGNGDKVTIEPLVVFKPHQQMFGTSLYHSVLTGRRPDERSSITRDYYTDSDKRGRITMINQGLRNLFAIAYGMEIGEDRVILELSSSHKNALPENLYFYEISVPSHSASRLTEFMQKDLNRIFPFATRYEQRTEEYLALVKVCDKLIPNSTDSAVVLWGVSGIKVKNQPVSKIGSMIKYYLRRPIIDETSYPLNVDMDFDAMMYDLDDVKSELRRFGFDLIEKEREGNVLVIFDPLSDNGFH